MTIRKYRNTDFSEILRIYSLTKLEELRFESEKFNFVPLNLDEKRFKAFKECEVFVYEESEILGSASISGEGNR